MKIVDMKEVEDGYWEVSTTDCVDDYFINKSDDVVFYFEHFEYVIKSINNLPALDLFVTLSCLIVDNTNNKVLKSTYFDIDDVPIFSKLMFMYTKY
jgi:hypothetical protein